jgi:hypothetical protein
MEDENRPSAMDHRTQTMDIGPWTLAIPETRAYRESWKTGRSTSLYTLFPDENRFPILVFHDPLSIVHGHLI